MLSQVLFLAWRYLRPQRNAVSLITLISITGVSLGVAILVVVLAVMTGFIEEMKVKLFETTAHIQVHDCWRRGFIEEPQRAEDVVRSVGGRSMPVITGRGLVQSGERFEPKIILGIDPSRFAAVVDMTDKMKQGKFAISADEVLVSDAIANELGLKLGDPLYIHSTTKLDKMVKAGRAAKDGKVTYRPRRLTVAGIYSFGKFDFDANHLLVSLDTARDMLELPPGSISCVYVWVDNPFRIWPVLRKMEAGLQQKFGYSAPLRMAYTWQEINRGLFQFLDMNKSMVFYILIFVVLVAAFSITNTLIIVVVQKTREIGLLRALGAPPEAITMIFVLQGMLVGLIGTAAGLVLGLVITFWRNDFMHFVGRLTGIHFFPEQYYYFKELPAKIVWTDVTVIVILSILLATVGGIVPAFRASHLDAAKALRDE